MKSLFLLYMLLVQHKCNQNIWPAGVWFDVQRYIEARKTNEEYKFAWIIQKYIYFYIFNEALTREVVGTNICLLMKIFIPLIIVTCSSCTVIIKCPERKHVQYNNNTFFICKMGHIASILLPTDQSFNRDINKKLNICDLLTAEC